jgi:hypothetical protein
MEDNSSSSVPSWKSIQREALNIVRSVLSDESLKDFKASNGWNQGVLQQRCFTSTSASASVNHQSSSSYEVSAAPDETSSSYLDASLHTSFVNDAVNT